MDRRTIQVDEAADLEDIELLERYAMDDISFILGSLMGGRELTVGGLYAGTGNGLWLPGPYANNAANIFIRELFPRDGSAPLYDYGDVAYRVSGLNLTIPVQLGLAQAILPDDVTTPPVLWPTKVPTFWSTLPPSILPQVVIGRLRSDFTTAIPLAAGAGEYRVTTISGHVEMVQITMPFNMYFPADPPNPIQTSGERERRATLVLTATSSGSILGTPPSQGVEATLPPGLVYGIAGQPPPAGDFPLFDIVTDDTGILGIFNNLNSKVYNASRKRHHTIGAVAAPQIRMSAEVEPVTFAKVLPLIVSPLLLPDISASEAPILYPGASVGNIPLTMMSRRNLMKVSFNAIINPDPPGIGMLYYLYVGPSAPSAAEFFRSKSSYEGGNQILPIQFQAIVRVSDIIDFYNLGLTNVVDTVEVRVASALAGGTLDPTNQPLALSVAFDVLVSGSLVVEFLPFTSAL